jgi:hypothetical protein
MDTQSQLNIGAAYCSQIARFFTTSGKDGAQERGLAQIAGPE